jgi:hypothetical protein
MCTCCSPNYQWKNITYLRATHSMFSYQRTGCDGDGTMNDGTQQGQQTIADDNEWYRVTGTGNDLMNNKQQDLRPSRKSVLYLRFLTISICYVCCNLSTLITIIQGLYRSTQIPHTIDLFRLDTQWFLIDFSTRCGIVQWPQNRSNALHITSTLKSVRNDNSRISSNILDGRICQYQIASSRPQDSPKQPTTIQQLPNDKSSHQQKFIKISYFQFWSYLILSL